MYKLIGRMSDNKDMELLTFYKESMIDTYWHIIEQDDRFIEGMVIQELPNTMPVCIRYKEYDERKVKIKK